MPSIMSATTLVIASLLSFLVQNVNSLASTDTVTWGGDNSRTGYQTNHNMDPSIVGSNTFGQIFRTSLPGNYNNAKEQLFAMPLVYTLSDGVQYLFVSTTQNNLYKINAKTGEIVASRNMHIPFMVADLDGCTDINPLIGVTGTGVIDPSTDTWYLVAKTYADQSKIGVAQGRPAGRQIFHAIDLNSPKLVDKFTRDMEGTVARNNPVRSFNGGIHHQRPALLHYGNYIYAGFGSHCVKFNFTGWIIGYNKMTGELVERFATQGQGVLPSTEGAGVWMSGGGIASDNSGSLFFATGNGYASQLDQQSVDGRNPPTALEEAAVHMNINDDGSLRVVDFFMPWEKKDLDGADKDLGTSPLELLPSEFSCGDVKRIGVITGKSGKTYWLNLDDMGGYRNGPNRLDRVIQVYQNENSVYAGAGVMPMDGKFIYINVIKYPTHVFQFSCSGGVPSFSKVADSPTTNADILGVGHGTTTSLNGQSGTGLVWTSDVEGDNLRIYKAIPENGLMVMIKSFNIPAVTKFNRPVFGDGRVYMGTTQGFVYGFGSPVNLPLICTTNTDFGTGNVGEQSASRTITCTAKAAITVSNIALTGNPNFNITAPATPIQLTTGQTFTFDAYFKPAAVGPLSSDVVITTTGNNAFSGSTPVTLRGNGQSVNPVLAVSPPVLSFNGVIAGADVNGVNQTAIFTNQGNSVLTINQILYSTVGETGPWITPTDTPSGPKAGAFTFINLPKTIPGKTSVSVIVNFDSSRSGSYGAYLSVQSDGGTRIFDAIAIAGTVPKAVIEFQSIDGNSWIPYDPAKNFTFGNVFQGTTRTLKLRVSNNGTADASALSLTVSKPPVGLGIISAANSVDLAEGTVLRPGESATANVFCAVPRSQWDVDSYTGFVAWTINTNDLTFGKHDLGFFCNAVSEQAPPLLNNGSAIYRYVGCFLENNPGRQLRTQLETNTNMTIPRCVDKCNTAGWIFCGTQYNRECWGGPSIPRQMVDDMNCNFPCLGNSSQTCGGNGEGPGTGKSYISLFADRTRFDGNVTAPTGPFVNPGVNGYVSRGCYTEGTNGRSLPVAGGNTIKTVAQCVAACKKKNYPWAGVEYGVECWCGNSPGTGSVPTLIEQCSYLCPDNQTEFCGAGSRLNMYQVDLGTSSSSSSSVSSSTQSSLSSSSTASLSPTSSLASSSSSVASSLTSSFSSLTLSLSSAVTSSSSSIVSSTASSSSSSDVVSSSSSSSASSTASSSSSSDIVSSSSSSSVSSTASSSSSSDVVSSSSSSSVSSTASSSSSSDEASSTFSSTTISFSLVTTTSSRSATPTPTGPAIKPIVGAYTFQGCWTEANTGRALNLKQYANDSMTLESCADFCTGYQMFGTEYGRECYCGNTLRAGSVRADNQGDCNYLCAGDKFTYCGAGKRLQLYKLTDSASATSSSASTSTSSGPVPTGPSIVPSVGLYSYYGCMTETAPQRVLRQGAFPNDELTIQTCADKCSAFQYFGTEYGRECYCGNVLNDGTSIVTDSNCNMECDGNEFQYCGAGNRLSVYIKNGTLPVSSSSSSTTTPVVSSSSSSSSQTTTTTPTLTSSSSSAISTTTTSVESSSSTALLVSSSSTTSAAVSSSSTTPLVTSSSTTSSAVSSSTTTPLVSSSSTTTSVVSSTTPFSSSFTTTTRSGSSSSSSTTVRSSSTTSSKAPVATGPVTSQGNANFTYYSCVSEPSAGKLLPKILNTVNMTINMCLEKCSNFKYAGVEYGRECYCGNTINWAGNTGATPGKNVTDKDCSTKCIGNSSEFCGAGNRLNLYWFDFAKAVKNGQVPPN